MTPTLAPPAAPPVHTEPSAPPAPFDYATAPIQAGRTLVEASAGTGKTFALAGTVLRLVLDADAPGGNWLAAEPGGLPDLRRLLVVTFTNAATDELRGRIRHALRSALGAFERIEGGVPLAEAAALAEPVVRPLLVRGYAPARAVRALRAALDGVDEAAIDTIHGFCKRVLARLAFESGTPFQTELVEDESEFSRRAAADVWTSLTYHDPLLAALAVHEKWTPDALMEHVGKADCFPDTVVLPYAPPLAEARAALDRARAALADVWEMESLGALAQTVGWNKKAALGEDRAAGTLQRVAEWTRGERHDAWADVAACTPGALYEAGRKQGQKAKDSLAALGEHPAFRACDGVADAVVGVRRSLVHAFVENVRARRAALKRRAGVVSFDDLITRVHEAIASPETGGGLARAIADQFAVALVDEFQDTDARQYAIFRTAFENRPLYLIGDPKQAIYAFRGADVHAYLRAQAEADRRFTLGTNFRSTPALVAASNALFGTPERAFLYEGITFLPAQARAGEPTGEHEAGDEGGGPGLVWWHVGAPAPGKPLPRDEGRALLAEATVAGIVGVLESGETLWPGTPRARALAPADLAVLVRTNEQAQSLQRRLRRVGVPAVVSQSGDIRASEEVAELERVLRALARPHDERLARAALATTLWGLSADALRALDAGTAEADERYARLREHLRQGQIVWRRHGVLRALAEWLARENVPARLLAFPDGERRMTNLRHALELIHEAEGRGSRGSEPLLRWLAGRTGPAWGTRDKTEMRLESDSLAVQLTTVHNSKGLQYPVVFLPFLCDTAGERSDGPTLPLVHDDGRTVYHFDPGCPDHARFRDLHDAQCLAEWVRLAYVAVTRAEWRCYLPFGEVRGAESSAPGYLLLGHAAPRGSTRAEHVRHAREHSLARLPEAHAVLSTLASIPASGMAVTPLPDPGRRGRLALPGPPPPPPAPARALHPDARDRALAPWRPASFSSWAAGGRAHGLTAPADDEPPAPPPASPGTGIHAFAAGRAAGSCLHDLLQHTDFQAIAALDEALGEDRARSAEGPAEDDAPPEAPDAQGETLLTERIGRTLARYGLARPHAHRVPISPHAEARALLGRVARLPLPGLGVALAEVSPDGLAAEWPFVLPLGRTAPAALADVFREHAAPPLADYADSLALLSPHASDGLLSGIADLVVCHEGRWLVVDWKSNHLGPGPEHYGPDALALAMREHHYVLQYHLYLAGLHRYLQGRLGEAYSYERDVAGAAYVFLRGLAEKPSPTAISEASAQDVADVPQGVGADKPPLALLDAICALLCP